MPLGGLKNGKPEKTLTLDSFLAAERGKESVARHVAARTPEANGRALQELACATIG